LGDTNDALGDILAVQETIGDTSALVQMGFSNLDEAIEYLSSTLGTPTGNETVTDAIYRLYDTLGESTTSNSTLYGILGQVKQDIAALSSFLSSHLPIIDDVLLDPIENGNESVAAMCTQMGSYFFSDGSRVRLRSIPSLDLSAIFVPNDITDMSLVDLIVNNLSTESISFGILPDVPETWEGFIMQDAAGNLKLDLLTEVEMPIDTNDLVICDKIQATSLYVKNIKLLDPTNLTSYVYIDGTQDQVLGMGEYNAEWRTFWPTTPPLLEDILFLDNNA
jgi:hypothetical protein